MRYEQDSQCIDACSNMDQLKKDAGNGAEAVIRASK
jgi:hypothetical protein